MKLKTIISIQIKLQIKCVITTPVRCFRVPGEGWQFENDLYWEGRHVEFLCWWFCWHIVFNRIRIPCTTYWPCLVILQMLGDVNTAERISHISIIRAFGDCLVISYGFPLEGYFFSDTWGGWPNRYLIRAWQWHWFTRFFSCYSWTI